MLICRSSRRESPRVRHAASSSCVFVATASARFFLRASSSSSNLASRSSSSFAASNRFRSRSCSAAASIALTSLRFDMACFPFDLILDSMTAMHLVICILVGRGAETPSAAGGAPLSEVSLAMRVTMSSALAIFSVSTRDAHVRRFRAVSAFLGWGVEPADGWVDGCVGEDAAAFVGLEDSAVDAPAVAPFSWEGFLVTTGC
mmetsp:Transcript_23292/g.49195  ORF Transcript_23292/g.49195 Transcript_23292/m.49195 type:complete len:202 (-) Transcript_23292:846-1451(-)